MAKPSKNVSERFLRYCYKVYRLGELLRRQEVVSSSPRQIPARVKLFAALLGLCCRLGSFHQIERMGAHGKWEGLLGPRFGRVSADSLGRALEEADARRLRSDNAGICRKARYNKVFAHGTIAGWMVAAIDGSETYKTRRPTRKVRESWKRRRVGQGESRQREYYEQALGLSYVGTGPRLALGIWRVAPGEDESATGLKAVKELDEALGWAWCDILCADAYYAKGPFINEIRARHKHVLIKVKQEEFHIVRDAQGLFAGREPAVRLSDATCELPEERKQKHSPRARYQVEIWDAEGFESWESVREPMRCLKVREIREIWEQGEWKAEAVQSYHIVTSVPRALMKPELVWLIMHRRWDIENSLFNDLTQNWAFTHCYTHDPQAIEALYALYAIAFNLTQLFVHRQLRGLRAHGGTVKEIALLLLVGFCNFTAGMWGVLTPTGVLTDQAAPGG